MEEKEAVEVEQTEEVAVERPPPPKILYCAGNNYLVISNFLCVRTSSRIL
jgi:hypothetical protein